MNFKSRLVALLFSVLMFFNSFAQLPLVYDSENTGTECEAPPLPDPSELPSYPFLPDPFAWSDGSGRSTDFADWECRRNEIKAEVEHYELGPKPDRPEDITASYADGTLTVNVTVNDETLTITSNFTIPEGDGPFPVVIGMNSGTGSLPSELFDGVILVPFMHNQVTTYNGHSLDDPYYQLYPDLNTENTGQYSAWAWGVSRLIDGLEIAQEEINADLSHIAVTGCSYAGKMALFSGAFDERVALTIAQESGGGGINSWRVSYDMVAVQGQEEVERISNTNYSWFKNDLRTYFDGANVAKLPYDHHEIMAMIAPRALLVLGNPPFVWLADESGYVSSKTTEKVYDTFGISERFGYSFRSEHDHCALPEDSYPEVQAFVDKFLFGDEEADTDIHYQDDLDDVDYNKWISGWEPPNPDAPVITIDSPSGEEIYLAPATVNFEATVTDINDNVIKVEFYNGPDLLGEDTEAPYSVTWTDIGVGNYYITAEAVDAEGLTGYSNIVNIIVRSPEVEVHSLGTVPTIDGIVDELWNNVNVPTFEATNILVGTGFDESDLSGTARIMWSNAYIYLLAEVTDDAKQNDSPNTYEDDNVEFYFDADNSKGSPYDANDSQITFAWNDGTTIGTIPAAKVTTGTTYKIVDTDNGYIVEARIPWSVLPGSPVEGMEVGFDFMINDDDDGGGRDGKLSWNATEDQAWQDASHFGTIKLVGTGVVDGEVADKEDQTINITAISDKFTTDGPFEIEASTTSQLILTYAVDGPASISGTTITLAGTVGTVTVTVSQEGNDTYNPAEESLSIEVTEPTVAGLTSAHVNSIALYPNPVKNVINIIGTDRAFEYQIINISGQLQLSGSSQSTIRTDQLSRGVYILNLKDSEKKTHLKFIKD